MEPVLLAHDLRKRYGPNEALRGLSLTLHAGRILGFLGPNGAGKTTAIRILTTILEPTSGYFVVDGIRSSEPERIRARIGVLPESLGFPKHVGALEYLTHFARLYGRGAADARTRAAALLDEAGLGARATSPIGTFSRGMRQRLGIARALVNDPRVVFLDEPTLGLDPRGQRELLATIGRIARERGAAVILCSHFLSEIEEVCDDVVILSGGQVVASGTVAEVVGRAHGGATAGGAFRIQVPAEAMARAAAAMQATPGIGPIVPAADSTGWLGVQANGEGASPELRNRVLEALIRADIPVVSLESEGGRLRDVFLRLTEEATQ